MLVDIQKPLAFGRERASASRPLAGRLVARQCRLIGKNGGDI